EAAVEPTHRDVLAAEGFDLAGELLPDGVEARPGGLLYGRARIELVDAICRSPFPLRRPVLTHHRRVKPSRCRGHLLLSCSRVGDERRIPAVGALVQNLHDVSLLGGHTARCRARGPRADLLRQPLDGGVLEPDELDVPNPRHHSISSRVSERSSSNSRETASTRSAPRPMPPTLSIFTPNQVPRIPTRPIRVSPSKRSRFSRLT